MNYVIDLHQLGWDSGDYIGFPLLDNRQAIRWAGSNNCESKSTPMHGHGDPIHSNRLRIYEVYMRGPLTCWASIVSAPYLFGTSPTKRQIIRQPSRPSLQAASI